jgi:SAM-dependent methyltransferase
MTQYFDLAEYYHYDHDFDFDLPFYEAYARLCGGPVLELGCGTGRLTIPLARAGIEMAGIDNSAPMLELCARALAENKLQDEVRLTLADMTSFALPGKEFGLVFIALRSFMHLLQSSEQSACLAQVHKHLRPGGFFIADVVAPDLKILAERPSQFYTTRREFDLPNGNRVVRQTRLLAHDPVKQIRHFEFKFEEYDRAGGLALERRVPVSTRYIFRYEMALLLKDAGFDLIDLFRDYDKNPYDGSGEMIVVAAKAD